MGTLPEGAVRVLDDGFVKVIDTMGDDLAIVEAARISYGAGTKRVSNDEKLIRYLMRHRHTTPFEMCEMKLLVRVPMDCWRQWIRHRTASVNEYSTRYSAVIDSKQVTKASSWRLQAKTNKQGSSGYLDELMGELLTKRESEYHQAADLLYNDRLLVGVAREQARKDLPLSTYTEAYWKINLHNLFHFLALRMEEHAQEEIRAYANVIGGFVKTWVPMAWAAFQDYRLDSMSLTARDIKVLPHSLLLEQTDLPEHAYKINKIVAPWGWIDEGKDGKLCDNRERVEFDNKTMRLFNFKVDWNYQFERRQP